MDDSWWKEETRQGETSRCGPRPQRCEREDQADRTGDREQEADAAALASAEPRADRRDQHATVAQRGLEHVIGEVAAGE
jgi:hypothetical protein